MTEPSPKPPVVAAVPDPKKLDEAAVKINTEYEAILMQDKNMKAEGDRIVVRAIAVGDMLLTVKQALKDEVGHGSWLPWLEAKCKIPERTAQRWMLLAKKKEVLAERMKSATMADLTLKQALDLCEDVEYYPDDEEEEGDEGDQGCGDLVNVSEKPKKPKKEKKKSKADKPEKEKIEYQKIVDPITANKAYQLFESYLLDALEELIERSNLDYAKECAEGTNEKLQGKLSQPEEEEEEAA